jgi:hypothetical protein
MSSAAVATKLVSDHQLQPLDPDGPKMARLDDFRATAPGFGVGKRARQVVHRSWPSRPRIPVMIGRVDLGLCPRRCSFVPELGLVARRTTSLA